MLMVFTGNGKGKTTAALGQALRAVGRGRKVLVIKFIKKAASGEDYSCKKLGPFFQIRKFGKGFVGILDDKFSKQEHRKSARQGLNFFLSQAKKGRRNVFVLDEVNVAVKLGLLKAEEVLAALRQAGKDKLVIFTGRDAPLSFIRQADYVTEMKEIKHPFQKGKQAEIGVEF